MNQYQLKVSRTVHQTRELTILADSHAGAQAAVLNAIEMDEHLFQHPRCEHKPGNPEIVEIREIAETGGEG